MSTGRRRPPREHVAQQLRRTRNQPGLQPCVTKSFGIRESARRTLRPADRHQTSSASRTITSTDAADDHERRITVRLTAPGVTSGRPPASFADRASATGSRPTKRPAGFRLSRPRGRRRGNTTKVNRSRTSDVGEDHRRFLDMLAGGSRRGRPPRLPRFRGAPGSKCSNPRRSCLPHPFLRT